MNPLILLDVDGPLNPWAAKPTRRPEGYTTHRLVPRGWNPRKPLRVWLNPGHGPMLRALAADTGAELVWATTWEHDANTMIGPVIGLPTLPVIEFGDVVRSRRWKYPAVLDYAGDRALVWLDDDFGGSATANARAAFDVAREGRGWSTLLHHVDPRVGLTVSDVDVVRRWLVGVDRRR